MPNNQGKQSQQEQPFLLINGKPATEQERRRIFGTPAQKPRKDETTTKPLHTDRGFNLMR